MHALSDQAVRVTLAIPLSVAARLAGVARPTLRLYEIDPRAIRDDKREACSRLYAKLRELLAETPFSRSPGAAA